MSSEAVLYLQMSIRKRKFYSCVLDMLKSIVIIPRLMLTKISTEDMLSLTSDAIKYFQAVDEFNKSTDR